jgi:proteasome assembly chaperone (PAC2) family protein
MLGGDVSLLTRVGLDVVEFDAINQSPLSGQYAAVVHVGRIVVLPDVEEMNTVIQLFLLAAQQARETSAVIWFCGLVFHAAQVDLKGGKGIAILKASEPNLRWFQFMDEVFDLCSKLGVKTIINVGSMYDDVLHSDRIISGIASSEELLAKLRQKNVSPISYNGPGGIHSAMQSEGQKRGFHCISLWCHCPYYLQGATHFGMLSQLGSLLSFLCDFELDVKELEESWKELNKQIQNLVEENPELNAMIRGLRKAKVRGSWASMKDTEKKNGKIIQLKDFLGPR